MPEIPNNQPDDFKPINQGEFESEIELPSVEDIARLLSTHRRDQPRDELLLKVVEPIELGGLLITMEKHGLSNTDSLIMIGKVAERFNEARKIAADSALYPDELLARISNFHNSLATMALRVTERMAAESQQ